MVNGLLLWLNGDWCLSIPFRSGEVEATEVEGGGVEADSQHVLAAGHVDGLGRQRLIVGPVGLAGGEIGFEFELDEGLVVEVKADAVGFVRGTSHRVGAGDEGGDKVVAILLHLDGIVDPHTAMTGGDSGGVGGGDAFVGAEFQVPGRAAEEVVFEIAAVGDALPSLVVMAGHEMAGNRLRPAFVGLAGAIDGFAHAEREWFGHADQSVGIAGHGDEHVVAPEELIASYRERSLGGRLFAADPAVVEQEDFLHLASGLGGRYLERYVFTPRHRSDRLAHAQNHLGLLPRAEILFVNSHVIDRELIGPARGVGIVADEASLAGRAETAGNQHVHGLVGDGHFLVLETGRLAAVTIEDIFQRRPLDSDDVECVPIVDQYLLGS